MLSQYEISGSVTTKKDTDRPLPELPISIEKSTTLDSHASSQAVHSSLITGYFQAQPDILALKKNVLALTEAEPDRLSEIAKELRQLIAQKLNATIYQQISALLKMLKQPVMLLQLDDKTKNEANEGQEVILSDTKLTEKSKIFKNIMELLEILNSLIQLAETPKRKKKDKYQNLSIHCQNLKKIYQNYIKSLCESTGSNRQGLLKAKVELKGAEIGYRYVSPEQAEQILSINSKGEVKKKNEFGTHPVTHIAGTHFKTDPEEPAIEFAIDSFNRIISGQGSTPSMLLKIVRENKAYNIQASKTVVGENLQTVLSKNPGWIKNVNPYNFSALFVLSLLTNPFDGKPDNYMVEITRDDNAEVKSLKIVGVDNDLGFTEPFYKAKDEHIVAVKNIIYLLPQMQESIDKRFREDFLHNLPEIVLIDWLASLNQQNSQYQKLIDEKIFSKEELAELNLPIKLHTNLIKRLYQTLQSVHLALRENSIITHQELFHLIYPELAACYESAKQKRPEPLQALLLFYFNAPAAEELLRGRADAEKLVNGLKQYTGGAWEFKENRTLSIAEAMENFVGQINFKALTHDQQLLVLDYLQDLGSLTHFRLEDCDSLTDKHLERLGRHQGKLKTVYLSGCNNISVGGMLALIRQHPQVEITLGINKGLDQSAWQTLLKYSATFKLKIYQQTLQIKPKLAPTQQVKDLHNFIQVADSTILPFLQEQSYDLRCMDQQNGYSLLHKAAQTNRKTIVEYLIALGLNVDANDFEKNTPLHFACQLGHLSVANILLDHHALLLERNKQGQTPLHKAVEYGQLDLLREILSLYKTFKEDLIQAGDRHNRSLLHQAAGLAVSDIAEHLILQGAAVNIFDKSGFTPLHLAAQAGNVAIAHCLLSHGADIHARDHNGNTPLDLALRANLPEMIACLQLYQSSSKVNILPLPVLDISKEARAEKISEIENTLALQEELYSKKSAAIAVQYYYLGELYKQLPDTDKAKSYFQQAYEIWLMTLGANHLLTHQVANALGSLGIKIQYLPSKSALIDINTIHGVRECLTNLWKNISGDLSYVWLTHAMKEIENPVVKSTVSINLLSKALKAVIQYYMQDAAMLFTILGTLKSFYMLLSPLNSIITEPKVMNELLLKSVQQIPLQLELVDYLISSGADVNAQDEAQRSVLHIILRSSPVSVPAISKLLNQARINMNILDSNNYGPLFYITDWAHRDIETAKQLFQKIAFRGADLELQEPVNKETILDRVMRKDKPNTFLALVAAGAGRKSDVAKLKAYIERYQSDAQFRNEMLAAGERLKKVHPTLNIESRIVADQTLPVLMGDSPLNKGKGPGFFEVRGRSGRANSPTTDKLNTSKESNDSKVRSDSPKTNSSGRSETEDKQKKPLFSGQHRKAM